MKSGKLIISLDFEMMWGCHDWTSPQEYGQSNVKHVREVIDEILNLFIKNDIHATFATVGLIMFKNKYEALENIPQLQPNYVNQNLSPYKDTYIRDIDDEYSYQYFGLDIINKLKSYQNIEIATHTFSHYFCLEKGQSIDEFHSDLVAAVEVAKKNGIQIDSIVFPKNMINQQYLKICSNQNINCYRGNAFRFYGESKNKFQYFLKKICRFLDSYIKIDGNSTYDIKDIVNNEGVLNIPASRFLRPYNHKLRILEPLKLRRIKSEIHDAAINGKAYHLWWHPHNFGSDVSKNMEILTEIIGYFEMCRKKYGMMSMTMSELSKII